MKKIVFFGSSPFSTIVLEKILHSSPLQLSCSAVITTPDKPVGRHLQLTPNPVKLLAQKNGIPVIENITPFPPLTAKPRAREKLREGTKEGDIDKAVGLVAAYGRIIPQIILDKFNGQIYNIHPSLLPKYRGPSPLQQQILDGLTQTGVTIIKLDGKMDHGPIVAVEKDVILPEDNWITLGNRLFSLGADLFLSLVISTPHLVLKEQDHILATYTRKLTRQSGFVPRDQFIPASLDRQFRALHPWPGVWTLTPTGQRLKLVSLNPPVVQLEGQSPHPWPM
ncbi:methionyl-tRNA formyltransferase [Candidatus Amesbacteria bacterium]|nr:methionyl-tRNA formyltransferase [Candidatus Amesbacteria bacterium]